MKATNLGWKAVSELKRGDCSRGRALAREAIKLWGKENWQDAFPWQELGCLYFALAVHGFAGNTVKAKECLDRAQGACEEGRSLSEHSINVNHHLNLLQHVLFPETLEHLQLQNSFPHSGRTNLGCLRYMRRT